MSNFWDDFTGLDAARFQIRVSPSSDGEGWCAEIWKRSIATGDRLPGFLATGHAKTKAQAVVGAFSSALGDALAELDLTACEVCGERVGRIGGRDAKTGRVVCGRHVS